MNQFKRFLNEKVTLEKTSGEIFPDLPASVQRNKIITHNPDIPIEEGDIFKRVLPNTLVEKYQITDAGFIKGMGGIPSHYSSIVRKLTELKSDQRNSRIIYNITGPQARVNINSSDSSTNIINSGTHELFSELRKVFEREITNKEECIKLLNSVDELENAVGSSSYFDKYIKFINLAADHVTILNPFLTALSQLILK